nr:MAG TPA: hypothetical protein [Caudoviricetes sp.]
MTTRFKVSITQKSLVFTSVFNVFIVFWLVGL